MEYTYRDLVEKYKKGEAGAIEKLIQNLQPLIKSVTKKWKNALDEDDLYQEVCLTIIESLKNYDPLRQVPFLAYVKNTVYFHIFNLARKQKEMISLDRPAGEEEKVTVLDMLESSEPCPEDVVIETEEKSRLYQALDDLPARQREVIFLHYFDGMSLKDISKLRGVHYKTVIGLKRRALKNLAKKMK